MPVDIPADGDFGAAFGAARLGLIAAEKADPLRGLHRAGDGRDDRARRRRLPTPIDDAYRRYRALYPAIKRSVTS